MDPIEDGLWAGGRVHEKSNQVAVVSHSFLPPVFYPAGSQEDSNRRRL
jgi:hypothetical protein